MVVDYTITIGHMIEIGSILAGGLAVLITMRNSVANLKEDVASMQEEIKKIGEVLIRLARFDEKLSNLDKRVTLHGKKIDDLQADKGFRSGSAGPR